MRHKNSAFFFALISSIAISRTVVADENQTQALDLIRPIVSEYKKIKSISFVSNYVSATPALAGLPPVDSPPRGRPGSLEDTLWVLQNASVQKTFQTAAFFYNGNFYYKSSAYSDYSPQSPRWIFESSLLKGRYAYLNHLDGIMTIRTIDPKKPAVTMPQPPALFLALKFLLNPKDSSTVTLSEVTSEAWIRQRLTEIAPTVLQYENKQAIAVVNRPGKGAQSKTVVVFDHVESVVLPCKIVNLNAYDEVMGIQELTYSKKDGDNPEGVLFATGIIAHGPLTPRFGEATTIENLTINKGIPDEKFVIQMDAVKRALDLDTNLEIELGP